MRMGELRIPVIILSFLIALGVLYGAQRLLYREHVTQPLEAAFSQVPGVERVKLSNTSQGPRIEVQLGPVENLMTTYEQLSRVAEETLDGPYTLHLVDKRGPLDELYYRWHFIIQQGIATGEFEPMIEELERRAAQQGIDRYRVYVDADAVYVQIHDGQHYLYERVPRYRTELAQTRGRDAQ